MPISRLLLFVLFLFGLLHIYLFVTRDLSLHAPMVAQEIARDAGFATLAVGATHTCATTTGGSVWCWGEGEAGQLGHGRFASTTTPVPVVGLPRPARSVAVGALTSCAILEDGALWCWGSSASGQIGLPSTIPATAYPQRIQGLAPVKSVALGHTHICASEQKGGLACWGDRRIKRGGAVYLEQHAYPQHMADAPILHTLAAGDFHTCGLDAQGAVYCWGGADSGALGGAAGQAHRVLNTPTLMPLAHPAQALAVGNAQTCALSLERGVWCWGQATHHDGPAPNTAIRVLDDPTIHAIASGWDASCGLLDTTTRCTSADPHDAWNPFPASSPALTTIAAQGQRICGLDAQGGAWCAPLDPNSVLMESINQRPARWAPDNTLSARWHRLAGLWINRSITLASAP